MDLLNSSLIIKAEMVTNSGFPHNTSYPELRVRSQSFAQSGLVTNRLCRVEMLGCEPAGTSYYLTLLSKCKQREHCYIADEVSN